MIVAFCGHSDYIANEKDEKRMLALLETHVGNEPCEFFLGEYGGFDRFSYRCAEKFRATHPNAKLVFVTPYLLTDRIKETADDRNYDLVIYPDLEKVPRRFAITHRNRWIVEQADLMIAYIDHEFGGAYTMYRDAVRKNKAIYNIANKPND